MMATKLNMILIIVGALFTILILEASLQTPIISTAVYAGSRQSRSEDQTSYSFNMVQKAQRELKDLGFNPGPIDGKWGPKTSRAVLEFQQGNNLPATGDLNVETRKKLFDAK